MISVSNNYRTQNQRNSHDTKDSGSQDFFGGQNHNNKGKKKKQGEFDIFEFFLPLFGEDVKEDGYAGQPGNENQGKKKVLYMLVHAPEYLIFRYLMSYR